jgi:hypothetical protein
MIGVTISLNHPQSYDYRYSTHFQFTAVTTKIRYHYPYTRCGIPKDSNLQEQLCPAIMVTSRIQRLVLNVDDQHSGSWRAGVLEEMDLPQIWCKVGKQAFDTDAD